MYKYVDKGLSGEVVVVVVVLGGEKAEEREPCRLRRLGSQLDTGMGEGVEAGALELNHCSRTTNAHGTKQAAEGQVYCRGRWWSGRG